MPAVPMFPLGTVLVPGMLLPLHVFEPRYRRLVEDCRAATGMFGVVLIERGSEVGGEDVRTDLGTMAQITQADELPDGRWTLDAMGLHRIRVERWLPDAPYPQAEITAWPDEIGERSGGGSRGVTGMWESVKTLLRRAAALQNELGEPAPPLDFELTDDPVMASYQAVTAGPFGPADRHALLGAASVLERFDRMEELLGEEIDVLRARLGKG